MTVVLRLLMKFFSLTINSNEPDLQPHEPDILCVSFRLGRWKEFETMAIDWKYHMNSIIGRTYLFYTV